MRKILSVLSLAAATALATPALAQPTDYYTPDTAALATGAVVGTVAGVGAAQLPQTRIRLVEKFGGELAEDLQPGV